MEIQFLPQVSGPCTRWVSAHGDGRSIAAPPPPLTTPPRVSAEGPEGALLAALLEGLTKAVRGSDEGGTMHARRLSTALLFHGARHRAKQWVGAR